MEQQTARLMALMINYDKGDARRIQHFVKVHGLASAIGRLEGLDAGTQFILETAAILHDIGIHISEQKYHSSSGKYQEIEGPGEAEKLLDQLGCYTPGQIARVKYLIGHHHTYDNIDGKDYQILVEADFLVNFYEDAASAAAIASARKKIFKTAAGTQMLNDMFGA